MPSVCTRVHVVLGLYAMTSLRNSLAAAEKRVVGKSKKPS